MFRNECVYLDRFQKTNIKITCRVDECSVQEIERMMNYLTCYTIMYFRNNY